MTVYTLFGQGAASNSQTNDNNVTLGMQFTLSQDAALTGIWFYSPPTSIATPIACCIFQVTGSGTGAIVTGTSNTSPSWSGAAGSGWVKCTYDGSVTLSAATSYKTAVQIGSTSGHYYGYTSLYWSSGAGGSGLTSGIITAPNHAGGDGGQDTFHSTTTVLAYPAATFNSSNYWIDVEVTTSPPPPPGPAGVPSGAAVAALVAAGAS